MRRRAAWVVLVLAVAGCSSDSGGQAAPADQPRADWVQELDRLTPGDAPQVTGAQVDQLAAWYCEVGRAEWERRAEELLAGTGTRVQSDLERDVLGDIDTGTELVKGAWYATRNTTEC